MKLLQDMSTEEICALTEEQLDRRVKLECAEQGIPMMPEPPNIEAFDLVRSVTAYQVSGFELYFKGPEAAKEVAALLERHQATIYRRNYDWRTGYDVEWLERSESDIKIETKMFYDSAVVRDREQFLVKRKTVKEDFEKQKKEYEESREKYRKIADGVYTEYYAAKRLKDSIESAKKTYQEYVSLAGGDTDKARVFFDKAFKDKLSDEVYFSVFPREVAA